MWDDKKARKIDYLRLSVTDRCNLRCIYCLPEQGIINQSHAEILTFEEILRLVDIFSTLGIKKIRLTGGEPLVRKGIISLIKSLSQLREINQFCLTTNGLLLADYAGALKAAGVEKINVSLDTLSAAKFSRITRGAAFADVICGIRRAREVGFSPLKLNVVVIKGVNEDEIIDFVEFAAAEGLILRFIEFMPVTPLWRADCFIPIEEVKNICRKKFHLRRLERHNATAAVYYRLDGQGQIGFIKTDVFNCGRCNRLRLSATGELKLCLYENQGCDLKGLLRSGYADWQIREQIAARIGYKQVVNYRNYEAAKLYMSSIGG